MPKTIKLDNQVHADLAMFKLKNETFNEAVQRLLIIANRVKSLVIMLSSPEAKEPK